MNSANRRDWLNVDAAGAADTGSMVAYIHDVSRGEVAVMIEGRAVTVTDHHLVARLAKAIAGESASNSL